MYYARKMFFQFLFSLIYIYIFNIDINCFFNLKSLLIERASILRLKCCICQSLLVWQIEIVIGSRRNLKVSSQVNLPYVLHVFWFLFQKIKMFKAIVITILSMLVHVCHGQTTTIKWDSWANSMFHNIYNCFALVVM